MSDDQYAKHIAEFLEGKAGNFIDRSVARILETKITTGKIDRDDVFQDARIALFQAFTDGNYRGGDLEGFVRSVTKTQILIALRAQYRRDNRFSALEHPDALSDRTPSAEESLEHKQRLALAARVVHKLGLECRRLLIFRFIKDLSYGEIATELSTTEGNARVMLHRCLTKSRTIARDMAEEL
jgi:RNA polymerase sigma factor (sigma-70 family)